jgi:hypothetical protein
VFITNIAFPKHTKLFYIFKIKIMAKSAKHPGFAKVAAGIEKKEGVSKKSAGAILASATRGASKSAKKANPALKKVK